MSIKSLFLKGRIEQRRHQIVRGYDSNRPDSYPYGLFRCYSGQCYIDPYDFRYNGDAVTTRPICAFAKGKCSISGEYN